MFTFDVSPDGREKFRVVATSRDVSMWERTFSKRSLAGLQENARMSDLEEIAHIAAKRSGHFDGSLADFRNECDIDPIATQNDAEGESDPTQSDR